MTAPLRFKDNRDLTLETAVLEARVHALHDALERERERRRDVERALENFVTENRLLHDQLEAHEHATD